MKFTIGFLIFFSSAASGQSLNDSCKACDINKVKILDSLINNASEKEVENFLCTLKSSCIANTEFAEYSNKVLFKLIDLQTKKFIKVLSSINSLDRELILSQLSSPLADYDFDYLIIKIQKTDCEIQLKQELIDALKTAKN